MTHQPERILVVGSGLAGLQVAERLRARGYQGALTLLGAEDCAPYDRPPLSKEVLRGEVTQTELRSPEDLGALDADLRLGEPAESLDLDSRVVHTPSGEHPFDVLVIATGAVARRIPGVGGHVLRTHADAATLRDALGSARSVAIVGAGLIGCEVAASARALGLEVDLYDVLAGPMIRVVGATTSDVVADLHRENGVRLHTGVTIVRDEGRSLCANDVPVEADLILQAVGGAPDVAWLAGSGLSLAHGVVCDEDGRAADGVYAVGDVARWAGHRSEHWTAATHQADHVSARITGQEPPEMQPAYWWSDQYGLRIQGLGTPAPDDDTHVIMWGPKERTVALYSRDCRLTGAVGFSAPAAVMRLGADIIAGTDVDEVLNRLTAPRAARVAS
jgi:3-phenylpropionate/trans-cinnamate dioxygenase ferredoxin reductase subunit